MSTSLVRVSDASTLAQLGECWTLRFGTQDEFGDTSWDVTPVVTITKPDGTTTTPVVQSEQSLGFWFVQYTLAATGRHLARVATAEDASDYAVYAYAPVLETGMPSVNGLALYLGQSAASWSATDLSDTLSAERAAQRAKCGERAVYPDDLRLALYRRCARSLAMRRLPLAVNVGDADGGSLILPGRDPEVRRLEAPYRRLVVG